MESLKEQLSKTDHNVILTIDENLDHSLKIAE